MWPTVVGEIISGILLGPTVFGPALSDVIFPSENKLVISSLGTLGLIFYMFGVGLDFDVRQLKGVISCVLIAGFLATLFPALIAVPLAFLLQDPSLGFSGGSGDVLPFLFMLASGLSVSALPVTAAILNEEHLFDSYLGRMGIGASAVVTVLMFLLLAVASNIAQGRVWFTAVNVGGLLALTVALFAIQLCWTKLGQKNTCISASLLARNRVGLTNTIFVSSVVLCVLAATATQVLGFTVLLGSFMVGVFFPFDAHLRSSTKDVFGKVTLWLLLPTFLATSGLQTNMRTIRLEQLLGIALIVLGGIAGKLAITPAVKLLKLKWKESLFLASLLDCRGLLVLVVNLEGQALGLTGDGLFNALVLLALASTILTKPLITFCLPTGKATTKDIDLEKTTSSNSNDDLNNSSDE